MADEAIGPPGVDQANALAEAQLTMQATFITNLDARSVGYLGISLALAALDITFRDGIGPAWWLPGGGYVVAAFLKHLGANPVEVSAGPAPAGPGRRWISVPGAGRL